MLPFGRWEYFVRKTLVIVLSCTAIVLSIISIVLTLKNMKGGDK